MIDHLIRAHGFNREGIERVTANNEPGGAINHTGTKVILPQIGFNRDVFKDLLIRWIIMNQVAFNQVVLQSLQSIFSYLCAVQPFFNDLADAMPTSSSTMSTWLMDAISHNKAKIQFHLKHNSISSIHLSFNLWTSSNFLALLGVIAFWVDNLGYVQHALLGLPQLLGSHTSENQGQRLWGIITAYGIQHNLGYFCLDNASNNLSAVRYISDQHRCQNTDGIQLNIAQCYI